MNRVKGYKAIALMAIAVAVFHPQSSSLAQSSRRSQLSWEWVLQRLFGQPRDRGAGRNGGSRDPDGICLLTPQQAVPLWNQHPVFSWQGSIYAIGIRPSETDPVQWRKPVPKSSHTLNQVAYTGKALEPGQAYDWLFFLDSTSQSPAFWSTFQVLGGHDRAQVTAALQTLDRTLKAEKASPEAIALQRANYFAQRGLSADALQEMYSVKHPSTELKQVIQAIEKETCESKK